MEWSSVVSEVFDLVVPVSSYPFELLGCLTLWLALLALTRANRLSLFVFSFSAWFLLLWVFIAALLIANSRPELDPGQVAFIVLAVLPAILFGYCTARAALTFGLKQSLEDEVDRGSRLLGVLLAAHILSFILILGITAFATG